MQYQFGSGLLYAIPSLAGDGTPVANPTPILFGALQDVSFDFSSEEKPLYGLYQDALAIGRGTRKATAKAKAARFTASIFNLIFGETIATGETKVAFEETLVITGNNGTVANNGTFVQDLGALYGANGQPLACGNAAASGVYLLGNNGVYEFDPTDVANNAVIKVSYAYGNNSIGKNFTVSNQLLGVQAEFQVVFNGRFQGKQATLTFLRAVSTKLTIATKLEDWTIPEFDMSFMVDDSGNLMKLSTAE